MKDVWGEELKVGDLVLILSQTLNGNFINSDTPERNYGIVVSSSSIYNGEGIKRYSFLYKIETLRDMEKDIYKKLTSDYNELLKVEQIEKIERQNEIKKRKGKKIDISRGDIVYDRTIKESYIYLGLVRIQNSNSSDVVEGYCYIKIGLDKVTKYSEHLTESELKDMISFYTYNLTIRGMQNKLNVSNPLCFMNNNFKVLKKHSLLLSNLYKHYDIRCYHVSFTFVDCNGKRETVWVDFI